MGRFFINIAKILFGILSLVNIEKYIYKTLTLAKINVNDLNDLTIELMLLLVYILITIILYFMFREDIKNDINRFKRRKFSNFLLTIVFFFGVTFIVYGAEHLSSILSASFHTNYKNINHLNIFNARFDLDLIIFIIKNIILIPIIKSIIIILGAKNIFTGKKSTLIGAGIIGSAIFILNLEGAFLFLLFNTLPVFALYFLLAYIYNKNNKNSIFSMITLILYTLLAGPLIDRLL